MKRLVSLVVSLVVVTFISSSVFAEFVPKTITSSANFSSQGSVEFSMDLKNVSGDSAATTINWDVANIPLKNNEGIYRTATVYAVLTSNITKNNGAIRMYQDNKSGTNYTAVTPRTNADESTVYSGLVNKDTHGGETKGYIPMVYCIKTTKSAPTFGTDPESVAGTRYFIDQSDSNFETQTNYITIANSDGLVQGVDSNKKCVTLGSDTGYMYFGGMFNNVSGGDNYGTEQIKVISVTE